MEDTGLDSQVLLVLWHESLGEHQGQLKYVVRGDGARIESLVRSVETIQVPASIRTGLGKSMVTPPKQVVRVTLACRRGLSKARTFRVEVRRTDVLVPVWDYIEIEPRWGKGPGVSFPPAYPFYDDGYNWPYARKEKRLRELVDELPPYGSRDFSNFAAYAVGYVLMPEIEPSLRWKVLHWMEALDKDRLLLSSFAREEIRKMLPPEDAAKDGAPASRPEAEDEGGSGASPKRPTTAGS